MVWRWEGRRGLVPPVAEVAHDPDGEDRGEEAEAEEGQVEEESGSTGSLGIFEPVAAVVAERRQMWRVVGGEGGGVRWRRRWRHRSRRERRIGFAWCGHGWGGRYVW